MFGFLKQSPPKCPQCGGTAVSMKDWTGGYKWGCPHCIQRDEESQKIKELEKRIQAIEKRK